MEIKTIANFDKIIKKLNKNQIIEIEKAIKIISEHFFTLKLK